VGRKWLNSIDLETDADGRPLIEVALKALAGLDVEFLDAIPIEQAAEGRTVLKAAEQGKVLRLHGLVATSTDGGRLKVLKDNDGQGAGEVALTGDMPVSANGGWVIPFNAHPAACVKAAAGEYLTIFTTGTKLHGYAIVSRADQ
jgi:hypothetical protein